MIFLTISPYVLLDVINVCIVFVLYDSIVLFYLLCIFNVNRAPWKSSIAILKGQPYKENWNK